MPRVRHRSEAANIDRGQLVGRRLKDRPIVVRLRELAPVGGRAAGGREGRPLHLLPGLPADRPRHGVQANTAIQREDASVFAAVQQRLAATPFKGCLGTREERIWCFHQYLLTRRG